VIATRTLASIGRIPWLGRAIRSQVNRYAEGSIVEIRYGHAAGSLWRRHHRYVNGYWIGHYELALQDALKRELRPGQTFFDVGAHAGFFTLLAAQLVGNKGKVIAFDPSPANCESIREQMELNSLCPFVIVEEAIWDSIGAAPFDFVADGSSVAHVDFAHSGNSLSVNLTTIDRACVRFGKPDLIKIDIEGAEVQALQGARHTLEYLRPTWLIELHGLDGERKVKELLQEAAYAFFDLEGRPLDSDQLLPRHFLARFSRSAS
jgi:FkbM family methyltransferase